MTSSDVSTCGSSVTWVFNLGQNQESRLELCVTESSIELVGQDNDEWHILGSLISGIAKHDALITSTVVLKQAVTDATS